MYVTSPLALTGFRRRRIIVLFSCRKLTADSDLATVFSIGHKYLLHLRIFFSFLVRPICCSPSSVLCCHSNDRVKVCTRNANTV